MDVSPGDELARLLNRHVGGAFDLNLDVVSGAEFLCSAADAIRAAGYRKHRIVITEAELEALPIGTNVLSKTFGAQERTWQRMGSVGVYYEWHCPDGGFVRRENVSDLLPALVLYEPEVGHDD